MKNKKIIVTGGAGFIGSHLVEHLVRNDNQVIVVDTLRRGNKILPEIFEHVEFHNLDVADGQKFVPLGERVDCVFHLAAILGVDIVADNPVQTMDTEAQGMHSVAQCCLKNNIPQIVYASTSGVYGHNALEQSVTEEITINPKTSYAMAKRFNEVYLGALHEQKGINSVALRYFNIYGPRQDSRMVIPKFFQQALNNEPITVFGTGSQTRDFTWINDTIEATVALADNATGFDIFNIANERELTIAELAKKIVELTGSKSEVSLINVPSKRYDYEVGRRFGSSQKLFDKVGFKPQTSIDEGLRTIYNEL